MSNDFSFDNRKITHKLMASFCPFKNFTSKTNIVSAEIMSNAWH